MKYDVGDKIININNNRTYVISAIYIYKCNSYPTIYKLIRKDPQNMKKSYVVFKNEGTDIGPDAYIEGWGTITETTCIEDLEINYRHLDQHICDRILND
jgi:hypothetical protein